MAYRLNCLDEPVFMAVSKPMQTEFGIHHRLESCGVFWNNYSDLVNMFIIKKSIKRSNLTTCELSVELWP